MRSSVAGGSRRPRRSVREAEGDGPGARRGRAVGGSRDGVGHPGARGRLAVQGGDRSVQRLRSRLQRRRAAGRRDGQRHVERRVGVPAPTGRRVPAGGGLTVRRRRGPEQRRGRRLQRRRAPGPRGRELRREHRHGAAAPAGRRLRAGAGLADPGVRRLGRDRPRRLRRRREARSRGLEPELESGHDPAAQRGEHRLRDGGELSHRGAAGPDRGRGLQRRRGAGPGGGERCWGSGAAGSRPRAAR
jgi:hypothetical protein